MSDEPLWRRYQRFLRADPRRDVDEEIEFHLAARIEEFERAGLSPTEARAEATRRFGDVNDVLGECHEIGRRRAEHGRRSWRWDAFRQDVRIGLRGLASNRGFALAVILTMALGIGANTAVFSVAYGILLRPLPFRDQDALVRLWTKNVPRAVEFFSVSPGDFLSWRAGNRAFSAMAAFDRQRDAVLVRGDTPEVVETSRVMPEIFPLLGTEPRLGRTLLADDVRAGAPAVTVIAYEAWVTQFGGDSAVVGRTIALDATPVTIVGVMPPRFLVPGSSARFWQPLAIDREPDDHSVRYLRVLGRLAPGATIDRAQSELEVVATQLAREHPRSNEGWSVNMMMVTENIVGREFRRAVLVLVGVVAVVLLIACANAANLQLARASARRKEIALRAALGATRGRVVTQLLTESALLSTIAGVIGIGLAAGGIALLRSVGTTTVPRLDDVKLDAPVLAFTFVVALGSTALFGLVPALRASRADVGEVLKEGGRGGDGGRPGRRIRSMLVVAEIALSLVLLVGAGLLIRSFARLQAVDVGFEPAGTLVVPLQLPEASYAEQPRVVAFYADLLQRVRALPGVTEAAFITAPPFTGPNSGLTFVRTDRPVEAGPPPDADFRAISPGLLRTLRIPLVRGRDVMATDRSGTPPVALITTSMARRYWPNEEPIGRAIRVGDPVQGTVYTIVGIVADARYQSLEAADVRPMVYFAAEQAGRRTMALVARTTSPATFLTDVQRTVRSADPTLAPPSLFRMEELIELATSARRFALVLLAVFAGTAMVLAVVGIYSVMAYSVRQQTHEFGIRVALGASSGALVGGVVVAAVRLAAVGVALGSLGALALTGVLANLLFGVERTDPLTFAAVAGLLVVASIAASLIPAWTASRADPMVALHGGK